MSGYSREVGKSSVRGHSSGETIGHVVNSLKVPWFEVNHSGLGIFFIPTNSDRVPQCLIGLSSPFLSVIQILQTQFLINCFTHI